MPRTNKPLRALNIIPLQSLVPTTDYPETSKTGLSWNRIEQVARFSWPVFSVISTRIKQIVSLDWEIVPIEKSEDILRDLVSYHLELYNEFKEDNKEIARQAFEYLKNKLPLLKDDLSNVEQCYQREKKKIRMRQRKDIEFLRNFFLQPNSEEDFPEFLHKVLWDMLVFGKSAIWKIPTAERLATGKGAISEFVSLKGSSVVPIRSKYVLSIEGYYQFEREPFSKENAIKFDKEEIIYLQYLPTNYSIHGLTPIEVVVSLIAEQIYYDSGRIKEYEEGKPPTGLLLVNQVDEESENEESTVPVSEEQHQQVQDTANKKDLLEESIKVLTGVDKVDFIDFSRKETDWKGLERQEMILKAVALVYNMSPQEIGLIEDVNRSTAESQEQSERRKGIKPLVQEVEHKFTNEMIKQMNYKNYEFIFTSEENRRAKAKIIKDELTWKGVNEIRMEEGYDPFPEEVYNRPPQQKAAGTEGEAEKQRGKESD